MILMTHTCPKCGGGMEMLLGGRIKGLKAKCCRCRVPVIITYVDEDGSCTEAAEKSVETKDD